SRSVTAASYADGYAARMLLGIDHIVIACRSPDDAAEEITQRVGLEAGGGGRHPRYGTYNRLVWLGDSYLELMGVEDSDLARVRGARMGRCCPRRTGRPGAAVRRQGHAGAARAGSCRSGGDGAALPPRRWACRPDARGWLGGAPDRSAAPAGRSQRAGGARLLDR